MSTSNHAASRAHTHRFNKRFTLMCAAGAAIVSFNACAESNPDQRFDEQKPQGFEIETGEVSAALTTVPTGLLCVKLSSSNGDLSKTTSVAAGASSATISLGQLPLGYTSITAAGFNVACGSVTATTLPNWQGVGIDVEILATGTPPLRVVLVPVNATNVAVDFIQPAVGISSDTSSYTISASGEVRAWGSNNWGQLGDGTTTNRNTPVVASAVGTVASIGSGEQAACAVTSAGALKCWGRNTQGQLGDGTSTNRTTPVTVIASGVSKVVGGAAHTCALMTNGEIRCTGLNLSGQLGNSTTVNSTSFVTVSLVAATSFVDVATGDQTTCGINFEKRVFCWGSNTYGQLGNGTTTTSNAPVAVSNLRGAESLSVAGPHTCARLADGTVWCWGSNASGQLGDNTTTNRTTPVKAQLSSAAVDVTAGYTGMTCAVSRYQEAYCWGKGAEGENGVGSGTDVLVPKRLDTLPDVLEISAGLFHVCARQNTGAVFCWGYNTDGRLGTGTLEAEFVPTRVTF